MKYFSLDQSRLLEFLHTLAVKHDIIFVSSSHAQDFIAGVCHWLLVMGTLADRVERAASDVEIDSPGTVCAFAGKLL